MKRQLCIDLNDFYHNGFSNTFVAREYYDSMLDAIEKMEWSSDERSYYNRTPSWTKGIEHPDSDNRYLKEAIICKQTLDLCPKEITDNIKKMLNDPRVTGPWLEFYDIRLDFVDIWDGVEIMGWHWDGPSQSDIISLIYFNDTGLTEEYGGCLQAGIRDIMPGSHWLKEYHNIKHFATLPPAGRQQAWVNNANPRFVHKTTELKDKDSRRMTMTFGCTLVPKGSLND